MSRPPQPEFRVQNLEAFRLPPGFRGRSALVVQLWWLVQATLFGCSPQALYGFRRWLLRMFGARIGKKVLIRPSAKFTYPWKVKIGDCCWIGDEVVFYSLGDIDVGHSVVISQRSYLCSATHDYQRPTFDMVGSFVCIEDEVWVSADVFVAPGVRIGRGAVIGARSSVFRNLPPMMVCRGSPALPIHPR
jgi:putative colanic acid biosynthesis acetyltransferase WcaF